MKKNDFLGLLLLAFVIGCRFSVPLADFYAVQCYPVISRALSWCAAHVPFSLEEIIVIGFAVTFIGILVRAVRRNLGFGRWLGKTARVAMWLVVWFYMGWGNNYFRTPLYPRMGIQRTSFEKDAFGRFLSDYTAALNDCAGADKTWSKDALAAEVRAFYTETVTDFGYTSLLDWQQVKKPLLNPLYSAVGVLGFMGPFFGESQLNLDLLDIEYPFTLAHEMAHLAGVTSEAEANYWAYVFCQQSEDPSVRYSGYIGLLGYAASNASALLLEDEYDAWAETLSPEVLADYDRIRKFWEGKRVKVIDSVQRWMMDLLLRSNNVSEGARDYFGVIAMIMTMDAQAAKEAPTPASSSLLSL
ncbi:MAG: DUF3810 domain-containing protein [Bacteroidales bacterium]|nr:DUF3810 domain-containing protein [Bacteroidales bacterium]